VGLIKLSPNWPTQIEAIQVCDNDIAYLQRRIGESSGVIREAFRKRLEYVLRMRDVTIRIEGS
jgi:hypothetical protein